MIRLSRLSAVAVLLVPIGAGPASAQSAPNSRPLERGYMTAHAGASFGDQNAPTFGVEIGERINGRVQAYVGFTYFDNLFNNRAQDDLVQIQNLLNSLTGTVWEFHGTDRGLAFSGGGKYLFGEGGAVRPYVGGGPGVLNLRRVITDRDLGDVSDPVLAVFGAPDGVLNPDKETTFKPMVEALLGVGVTAGRAYVDVGYRFRKVFKSAESFNFSQLTVGVGMRF